MSGKKAEDYTGWSPDHSKRVLIYCPGCTAARYDGNEKPVMHCLNVTTIHTFDGNYDAPTFSPSLMWPANPKPGDRRCHSFINAGMIQFLGDSTHPLAGQTVPLLDVPESGKTAE